MCLDDDAHDGLAALKHHGVPALVAGAPQPVADRVLGLQADNRKNILVGQKYLMPPEEEGGGEVVNVVDAGCVVPGELQLALGQLVGGEVAVRPEDEVPDQGEEEPGQQEAREEDEEEPPPAQVHQRGPAVLDQKQVSVLHPNVDNT